MDALIALPQPLSRVSQPTFAGLKIVGGSFVAPAAGAGLLYSTSASGLVLVGNGSSSDVIVVNASGNTAIFVPHNTQNVLIAGLTTNGTGALQLPAGAGDATAGITHGTDWNFFRVSSASFIVQCSGASPTFDLKHTGGTILRLQVNTGSGDAVYDSSAVNSVRFKRNGSDYIVFGSTEASISTASVTHGANGPGGATTMTRRIKAITAIANAVATSVLTITIPNTAQSAGIRLKINGSLGAGGAIGANEATGTICYDISVARTAGVNAVATISAAYGSATSAVAGASTITVAAALAAVVGAVGASNTIDVQVTITRGSGTSTNHTSLLIAEIINANATGISIA